MVLTLALLSLAFSGSAALKYVFLFIGDGMGMGHVMSAESYNRLVKGSEERILMMRFPVASMAMTYSANSPITDSAAAGTALATGHKTNNGMVGVLPDSTAVESVARQLKDRGFGVGVVTSVAFDDATPASFYAHQPARKMAAEICRDGARSGFDFIGGAYTHVADREDGDCEAVFDDFRANGYEVAHGLENLPAAARKVLLTGRDSHSPNDIGYTIDSIPGAMRLRDMTAACLSHLRRVSPDGFFMMVEGGNIDHAAHGNDGATVVKEVLNFQESIQLAYDFYLLHPDETLIVITADHDTGGMTLGVDRGRTPTLADIDWRKASKEKFNDYCMAHRDLSWAEMKTVMSEKLGLWSHIEVTAEEEAALKRSFDDFKANSSASQKTLYKEFNNFSAKLFDLVNHKNGIGFTTFGHTGNPVPVFAVGEGSDLFRSLNNNVEIPQKIRKLTGIE